MNQPSRIVAQLADEAGFTARDYQRMYERGAFQDGRVELVRGELRKMLPSFFAHGEMNMRVGALLLDAYKGRTIAVAVDLMVAIDDRTIRGADIAVVPLDTPRRRAVPAGDALLIVEIAGSSLAEDLGEKLEEYRTARVATYWVVDLEACAVHVMSDPSPDGYHRSLVRFGEPLAVPGADRTIVIE